MSDSLRSHGLQHIRLTCPSATPRAYSNSCPSIRWYHPTISSSVVPFSSCFHLSQHQGLFHGSVLHVRWPKCWNFSITPSDEYTGLVSFRIDWFDHLPVQGTLKSLLQHRSSKASILRHSAFFMVQLSHLYMTTGKTIALTRWTFAGKVIFLLFNMLCRFVIVFLPRNNLSYKNNTIIITLLVFRYVSQWNFGLVNRTTTHDVCHQFLHLYLILQVDWPFPLHHQFAILQPGLSAIVFFLLSSWCLCCNL